MNDQENIDTILDAAARRCAERRRFLQLAGGASVAAGGLALLSACGSDGDDDAPTPTPSPTSSPSPSPTSTTNPDGDVLNFALQLEYLTAQFYAFATTGVGLPDALLEGTGTRGAATGGALVPFADPVIAAYAREIARDERAHVEYLRTQLGAVAVAQPTINLSGGSDGAFTVLARTAGVVGASGVFNPYANDDNFLLGAFLFEDLSVTAYKGLTPLVGLAVNLTGAAGILAAESYHAGLIRSAMFARGIDASNGLRTNATGFSNARDSFDGASDLDQGIVAADGSANIVPTDGNGVVYSRSTGQVLNILYLNSAAATSGGFFPAGLNGNVKTSAAN